MSENYLVLASLIGVISIVAFSLFIKFGKRDSGAVDTADEYEDEDLTITLLNINNMVSESDFK